MPYVRYHQNDCRDRMAQLFATVRNSETCDWTIKAVLTRTDEFLRTYTSTEMLRGTPNESMGEVALEIIRYIHYLVVEPGVTNIRWNSTTGKMRFKNADDEAKCYQIVNGANVPWFTIPGASMKEYVPYDGPSLIPAPVIPDPSVTLPEVFAPSVASQIATEPVVAFIEVAQPLVPSHMVPEPVVASIEVTQQSVSDPVVTEHVVTVPEIAQPSVFESFISAPEDPLAAWGVPPFHPHPAHYYVREAPISPPLPEIPQLTSNPDEEFLDWISSPENDDVFWEFITGVPTPAPAPTPAPTPAPAPASVCQCGKRPGSFLDRDFEYTCIHNLCTELPKRIRVEATLDPIGTPRRHT